MSNADQPEEPAEGEEGLLGEDPDSGGHVFVKDGRFGPYVQLVPEGGGRPKNVSLLQGMEPSKTTLELALKLLSLPRTLGDHPDSGEPVTAHTGRYGPYIKCGAETRSLPADISPLDVELGQALLLLAQPKKRKGQGSSKALKELDTSPVTNNVVKILEGKYGPYITDGETNVSVPKGVEPHAVEFDEALRLLAERAAKGKGKSAKSAKSTPKNDEERPPIPPSDEPPF